MGKDSTLIKIDEVIARGDLGRARDRMHGLLAQYPEDLKLRRKLGEIYLCLHQPVMAGRYWYLEEELNEKMEKARADFERYCGGDPIKMLKQLKFLGDLAVLDSEYARQRLVQLQREAKSRGYRHVFERRGTEESSYVTTITERLIGIGCISGFIATLLLALIGLTTLILAVFS